MDFPRVVLTFAFRLALILAATGTLISATLYLQKAAYKSVKSGLIRLHPINKSLVGPTN